VNLHPKSSWTTLVLPTRDAICASLRLVGVAVMLVLILPAAAQAQFTTESDGNGGLIITGYTGTDTTVVIPGTIGALTVTGIAGSVNGGAFYANHNIISVTFPNTVMSIGIYAFKFCNNLRSVTIPDGLTTIGEAAFAESGLTSVTIPNSVTSIGASAFYDCASLASVTIPNSVTSIGASAFDGCTSLTSVTIPSNVTSIGDEAFSDTGLTSVTIPSNVTSIGNEAFYDCTSLTSITVSALNPSYSSVAGVLFNNNQTVLIQYPASEAGSSYTIPSSVSVISNYAFFSCESLTSVTIPTGVTSIGQQAFEFCKGLPSVTIPNSVTSIGEWAFQYCTNLTSATFMGNAPTMGTGVFLSTASGFTVDYYNGTTGFTSPLWLDSSGDSWPAVNLGQAAQTITFPTIANQQYPGPMIALGATAASGLAVSYSVESGPATVSGSTLTLTGTGTVTVQASQAGNVTYLAATSVSQSFTVTAAPTLTFAQWEAGYSFSGSATATPEGDGVPNLLKYVYNINPALPMTTGEKAMLPVVTTTATTQTLTYYQYFSLTGVTVEVQTSPDLQTWTTVPNNDITQIGAVGSDAIMQAQVTITPPRQFIRLNVTSP